MAYLGSKVKEDNAKRISDSLSQWLTGDEFIVAFFNVILLKPQTDVIVITNKRLLSVYLLGLNKGKGFPVELVADDIEDTFINKFSYLHLVLKDGSKKKIGLVRKEDSELILKAIKKISGSPTLLNINEREKENSESDKDKLKRHKEAAKLQHEVKQRTEKEEVKQLQEELKEQHTQLADVENSKWEALITGKVSKAALREVKNSCRDSEMPEFILGDGINGVLVAFSDRCMVIKKGLATSFMTSSLGGGRVATFVYRDITGIEYNSGILTGVLEILTSSYTGKTTNSPWAFGNDKSAHESSNTLPWGKIFYGEVRPKIEWLKQKIIESKTSGSQAALAPQSTNATGELSKLADLHRQGILTDKEFETAKQKIISKM